MLTAIKQWVIQTMMKGQTGVVRTLPRQEIIELNTQITAERIMRNGINPDDLKTVGQVENVINQIDTPKVNVNPGMTSVKKADVLDMEGNKINTSKGIMGGKQVESDAVIKARLDADNKKGIAGIKNNKMIDDAIEDASPGFADGDTKYDAELVAENLAARRGLTYDDLSPKERSKIYGEAYDALAGQRFRGRKKPKRESLEDFVDDAGGVDENDPRGIDDFIPEPEDKADGGRIGLKGGLTPSDYLKVKDMLNHYHDYKKGGGKKLSKADFAIAFFRENNADGGRIGLKAGMTKRAFMKLMGSTAAGIGAAKSGIFSGFGKGAGKTVAKEVAQQTTSGMPPPYFFKLAEKIKKMGDDATATTDRTIAKTLDSKDGKSTYLLEEDVTTGDTIIKKINKEGDEMITDVEIMELRKGEVVRGKDGKVMKTPDEYEEVTEANARIEGDVFNDPYYSDGIQVDDIIKEVDDTTPSIKYASGGLAYMLGE